MDDIEYQAESEGESIKRLNSYRSSRPKSFKKAALKPVPPSLRVRRVKRSIAERFPKPYIDKPEPLDWLDSYLSE